jgi:hypothetical protein
MRELDLISKSLKNTDATLLRKDFSLFQANLSIDVAPFLREIAARAKREKKGNLMLIAILNQEKE